MMIDSRPNGYHQMPRARTEVILSTDGSDGSSGRARLSLISGVPSARRQRVVTAMAPFSPTLYSVFVSRAQRLCKKPGIAAISYQVPRYRLRSKPVTGVSAIAEGLQKSTSARITHGCIGRCVTCVTRISTIDDVDGQAT